MRVADYMMQRLARARVRHVFQVTGRGALFLNDAVAKHADLTAVSLHHEQACAFATIGYAEQTGGIGACLVSTGCAATNTLTGVLSAWQDAVPCIFISGQHVLRETSRFTGIPLRTYGQQEADIVSLVSPMTKYAKMLTAPEDIEEVMEHALWYAQTGRKGPVWLDIPLDLQSAQMTSGRAVVVPQGSEARPLPKEEDIQKVVAALCSAQRPVVLIGSGVRAARALVQLKEFVERWNIPVTYTAAAPDSYGTTHPLSIGSVGAMGCSRAGNFTVQNADFVLVLGSRLTSLTTGPDFSKFARAARVTVVDIDRVEHSKKSIRIDQMIHSDLGLFLARLNQEKVHPVAASWVRKCQHWKQLFRPVEPEFSCDHAVDLYELADCLSEILPNPSTLVTDSGLAEVILPTNIRFADGMQCIHPTSQGAMGFALPAAIGAQHAKAQPVVVVVGDGSIMMNLQELESIRYQRLPIKIIVINNNGYSIIRRRQRELFRHRTIGTDPDNGVSCLNFARVADCFGLQYSRIERPAQMAAGLTAMLACEGPVLCEVMGRVDQGYIELGQARSVQDRRLVRRPLEDQEPYLSRELFFAEMIVDPIEQ
ncbi:MAG: thiamine pyrophosphate-binding protein [Nitrospira sp.]|nr:thiamine pyrophosphate-binding protein [Nitrospira sp.]MDH4249840.1 thiamine pyrophosphate-binding protein [Nitrospira sp.]MDH4342031.1 thiamine pyrophosphate-binding protein [Nitrospira sp.]MDH5334698.1 thiamine pyrophosphate-binding protein [Nitrospira sp.]